MSDSWSESYKKRIRELLNDYADTVSGGSANDFAEYRRLCGVIEGLAIAEREFLDLISRMEIVENG